MGSLAHLSHIFCAQGRLLNTPELIPFRLTRDIVAGMGLCGVEGSFRRCGEATMAVLRDHADALCVIVEVFIHDPLYQWVMSTAKQSRHQVEVRGCVHAALCRLCTSCRLLAVL